MSVRQQDIFLNYVRKNSIQITIFLVSGYQIKGMVTGFDQYTIMLDSDGKQQLIYKHAVSTIIPHAKVDMHVEELEG